MKALLCCFLLLPLLHGLTLTTPQALKKKCLEENVFGSCYELAWLYQNTSVPGDQAIGKQFLMYACKLELDKKCTVKEALAGKKKYMSEKWKWEKEKDEVVAKMASLKIPEEKSCWKGDAQKCEKAAIYHFYLAPIRNPQKGFELYKKGCKLGNEKCCQSMSLIEKGIVKVFDVEI